MQSPGRQPSRSPEPTKRRREEAKPRLLPSPHPRLRFRRGWKLVQSAPRRWTQRQPVSRLPARAARWLAGPLFPVQAGSRSTASPRQRANGARLLAAGPCRARQGFGRKAALNPLAHRRHRDEPELGAFGGWPEPGIGTAFGGTTNTNGETAAEAGSERFDEAEATTASPSAGLLTGKFESAGPLAWLGRNSAGTVSGSGTAVVRSGIPATPAVLACSWSRLSVAVFDPTFATEEGRAGSDGVAGGEAVPLFPMSSPAWRRSKKPALPFEESGSCAPGAVAPAFAAKLAAAIITPAVPSDR